MVSSTASCKEFQDTAADNQGRAANEQGTFSDDDHDSSLSSSPGAENDFPPVEEFEENAPSEDDEEVDRAEAEATLDSFVEIYKEQMQKGNRRFTSTLLDNRRHNSYFRTSITGLVYDVNETRNRHTMPRTWRSYRNPASMYYN